MLEILQGLKLICSYIHADSNLISTKIIKPLYIQAKQKPLLYIYVDINHYRLNSYISHACFFESHVVSYMHVLWAASHVKYTLHTLYATN